MLNESDRKVLRKIYGPVLANGKWRNRYNNGICCLYKETELTRNIRLRRLQWAAHLLRMKDEKASKKGLKGYTEGRNRLEVPEEEGQTHLTGIMRIC
jgi:hypothetical protein